MRFTQKKDAFTLMEILIVVFIIGLLAATVGPNLMRALFKGKTSSTQAALQSLKAAIYDYQMDVGSLPPSLDALVNQGVSGSQKWHGPYLEGQKEAPRDGWEHDFIYNKPPQEYKENYKSYEIISHGEDEAGDDKAKWLHTGA